MTLIRRKFADDGDMLLNNFVTESEATIQATATRLRIFLEEYFLNKGEGTDYFGKIFKRPFNKTEAELELKRRVLNTDGIASLNYFYLQYNSQTRQLTLNFEAVDDWGNSLTNDDLNGINPLNIG